ncbi:insulinase family protein [Neptunicella sp. SCSIO 80796]|uniref:insulinase family protein n=1 Tax=Neptunicella plasticusilytica TaxID=3117012 RepID=UPI003A4DFE59
MIKSLYDHRNYRYFILENGIKVLLVSDQQCKKSAAAINVECGHFNDPDNCEGLAHLLEHMLFLGCADFPDSNHLSDFLSLHAGQVNAWTGTEYSSFYFDVHPEHFSTALQHFSSMLCKPLFDPLRVRNEIESIDAEFKMKRNDDLRRLYQVHKETCNPQHPFSRFSVGNKQTLTQLAHEELVNALSSLHQQHYGGEKLTLCLIAPDSLDDIQALAQQYFDRFAALKQVKQDLPALYRDTDLATFIQIKPVKTARRLILTFALDNVPEDFTCKPVTIISYLLGDEGEGSLLWFLKEKNWATNLSAGGGIQGSNFKDFNINLQLTTEGISQLDAIVNVIFYQIEKIRQQGLPEWRFAENRQLNQLTLDFHEPTKSINYATHLASQLHHYQQQHVLTGDILLHEYNPQRFQQVLSRLTPHNMRLKLIHPDAVTNKIAKWYNTPYQVDRIPTEWLSAWSSPDTQPKLQLPKQNPYVTNDTSLLPIDSDFTLPKHLIDSKAMHFWFAQDELFKLPKGDIYLSFDCPFSQGGIGNNTLKRLWVATLQEQLNESFYQSELAGLNFHLYPHQGGFTLHTSGFAEKQLLLANSLVRKIFNHKLGAQRFNQIKQKQLQAAQNSLLNKPVNRLFNKLSVLLQRNAYSPADTVPIIQQSTLQQVELIREQLLSCYHIQSFMHGNWSYSQAQQYGDFLQDKLLGSVNTCEEVSRHIVDLRELPCSVLKIDNFEEESAVVVYFQSPSESVADTAMTILAEQIWAGPFFNQLRTEQQLGYMVGTGYFPINQHPGMAFYIQSPDTEVNTLVTAIHDFIQRSVETLSDYPAQRWEHQKKSVAKQLVEKDQNLAMKSQRLWLAIANKDWQFEQQQKLAEYILALSLENMQQFCQNLLQRNNFGELILYCPGQKEQLLSVHGEPISSISEFKKQAYYIP